MTSPKIHALRENLADAIAADLTASGSARVYGPATLANRVANAAERAGRMAGVIVTVRAERVSGWTVTAEPAPGCDDCGAEPGEACGPGCSTWASDLGDEEPDREPSAEQERAWDAAYDGTSLGR